MRRFRAPHEAVLDDSATKIHWRGNPANGASPLYHSSYQGTGIVSLPTIQYRMDFVALDGSSITQAQSGLFYGGANSAWRIKDGGWLSAASPSTDISAALRTSWSLSFWTNGIGSSPTTTCFIEYAKGSTLSNNELNMLGVYASSNGVFLRWDISTTTQQIIDTNVIPNGNLHVVHRALSATRGTLEVYRNGELRHTTASTWFPSQTSLTSNWTLFASGRYGNATGTSPAYMNGTLSQHLDDFVFWTRANSSAKARAVYGDARRPWDEKTLIRSGNYKTHHRVLVYSSGEWVDLSNFRGKNWCVGADVRDSAEDPLKKATIRLRRRFGINLDLSRLNTQAELTYGRASEPMIDLRTKIRVEYALTPVEWSLQGWEWVQSFDGLVKSLDWSAGVVEITAADYGLALEDVYRIEPRRYEYGSTGTPSWAHMAGLLDDNTPVVMRPGGGAGGGWTPGYIGGTPEIFTPVDPLWQIRYDHSPGENVLRLLTGTSDQIGWDCRYRRFEPWEEDRLTFSEPPRTMTYPIERISESADGFMQIRFGALPPGLQVGQTASVAFSNVAAFNIPCTVTEILDYHTVKTDAQPAGSPSSATTGAFFYGPAYTIPVNSVRQATRINANADSIRNVVEVRYDRKGTAATLPLLNVEDTGGGSMWLYTEESLNLGVLEAGNDLTISSTSSGLNAVVTVVSVPAGNTVEITPVPESYPSLTGACGVFFSSYLTYGKLVSVNSASIIKFGLRKAGIFEGSIGGIDRYDEARRLADGVLSDLAYPTVDLSVDIKCAPWLDIYDMLALERDPLGRWGGGTAESPTHLTTSVVGYTHSFGEKSGTSLELRHDHPTKGRGWLKHYGVIGGGVAGSIPDSFDTPATEMGLELNNTIGQSLGVYTKIPTKKRNAWVPEEVEYIAHTTWSAAGSRGQMDGEGVIRVKGNSGVFSGSYGNNLTPGTTYYIRARARDKFGNYSNFTATQSFVPRFTTKPAAAMGSFLSGTAVGYPNGWAAVPLTNDSTSPCFDNWGNLSVWTGNNNTAQWVHQSSAAFIMPCNGDVAVEGWLGFSLAAKALEPVSVGLFRLNSTLPKSGGSLPFLYPKLTAYTGYLVPHSAESGEGAGRHNFLMGTSIVTLSFYTGQAVQVQLATQMWVAFSEKISANSGDRVVVGVHAGTTNDLLASSHTTSFSNSTSWVKFTVVAQN